MTTSREVRTDPTVAELVLARTVALCAIPAPPMREAARASVVAEWWRADAIPDVALDEVGNLWGHLRQGQGDALLVCAHLDTVFEESVEHGASRVGDRLVGPGVGDDAVAVAALSVLDRLLPADLRHPVWIVATVGEEGLGNLRGITHALDSARVPVGAVVAIEGNYLGQVNTVGVGSVRWEVSIKGPGGHAWEAADAPSAVHCAAGLVARIASVPSPEHARTSVNVGTIHGGESVNSRAQTCTFQIDVRADSAAALQEIASSCEQIFTDVPSPLSMNCRSIGTRPAGHIEASHPLVRASADALRSVGVEARLTAASTDANAAYARGVPAVTVGVTVGSDTHTEAEWILVDPVASGLTALAQTIITYDREDW